MSKSDILKQDLYGILEVAEDATSKEIIRAYRKKALKCHPDKNPDNPKAAELFHQLSEALEVLTDAAARAAYDKIIKAKKAAALRHKELDSKRKKFKEDLEAREFAAQNKKDTEVKAEKNLEAEIKRLRKEGSALLKAEQDYLNEQVHSKHPDLENEDTEVKRLSKTPKLKVKWKAQKGDESNGGYTTKKLELFFTKYGVVLNVLVSSKRMGSAIVEMQDGHAAILAVQNEIGIPENPLKISWLEGQPETVPSATTVPSHTFPSAGGDLYTNNMKPQVPSSTERDFESLVLRKMRQAEERKRLAEEIAREDAEDGT